MNQRVLLFSIPKENDFEFESGRALLLETSGPECRDPSCLGVVLSEGFPLDLIVIWARLCSSHEFLHVQ